MYGDTHRSKYILLSTLRDTVLFTLHRDKITMSPVVKSCRGKGTLEKPFGNLTSLAFVLSHLEEGEYDVVLPNPVNALRQAPNGPHPGAGQAGGQHGGQGGGAGEGGGVLPADQAGHAQNPGQEPGHGGDGGSVRGEEQLGEHRETGWRGLADGLLDISDVSFESASDFSNTTQVS